jgi:hypothetical protein
MSWFSRKRRPPRSSIRPLRVEPLESRSLLAVAEFTINLLEDVGGTPGAPLTADEIEAGDSFFVEIQVQEFHPFYTGLQGVALDIDWDPAALQIDGPFDPAQAVTTALPMYVTGTLDATAGMIRDLGGSAFPAWDVGHAIGDGSPERFALLHFRAVGAAGATSISLAHGDSGIATMPVSSLSRAMLSFERQSLEVVPHQAAPAENLGHSGSELPPVPIQPPPVELSGDEPVIATAAPPPAIVWSFDPAAIWGAASEPIVAAPPTLSAADPAEPLEVDLPVLEPVEVWLDETLPSASADEELLDLIAAADPAAQSEPTQPATDACSHELRLADYLRFTFVGPQTPEQSAPVIWRLEELIALLAAEADQRRAQRSNQSTTFVCS